MNSPGWEGKESSWGCGRISWRWLASRWTSWPPATRMSSPDSDTDCHFLWKQILLASALGKSWDAVKVDQIIAKITWNLILGTFHDAAHQQRRLQHLLGPISLLTFLRHVEDAWFSEKTTTTKALPTQHEFQFNFSAIYPSLWRQLPVDSRRQQCVSMDSR